MDKLITDLTALQKDAPDSGVVFADVSKFFLDFPQNKPALWLRNDTTFPQEQNLSFDEMRIGFEAVIYDVLQSSPTQSDTDMKVDRLASCEWYLYDYLAKIPDNIGEVDGVTPYAVIPGQVQYSEIQAPEGMGLMCRFSFALLCNIDVKLI